MRALRLACTALVSITALAGCHGGGVVKSPTSVEHVLAATPAPPPRYIIGPGDDLEIVFFHRPDRNIQTHVRPDGSISVPLAPHIRAAGRTPEELRLLLTEQYAKELVSPEIAVVVRAFAAWKIHVGGEVKKPGEYPLTGPMTVLDAVLQAGIVTRTARLDETIVIRPDPANRSYKVIPVNLKVVMNGTDATQNIALGPFDAIFVPTSPIADMNTFVDLYIRQNLPVDITLRFGTTFID